MAFRIKLVLSTLFLTIKWQKLPLEPRQEFNIVFDSFIDKKKVDNSQIYDKLDRPIDI